MTTETLCVSLRRIAKGQRDGVFFEGVSVPEDFVFTADEAADLIERLASENEATLRVLEKATHELEAFHRCVIDDSTRAEIGALIVECWDHLAALSKKGEGE